jgi:hypothetical protein
MNMQNPVEEAFEELFGQRHGQRHVRNDVVESRRFIDCEKRWNARAITDLWTVCATIINEANTLRSAWEIGDALDSGPSRFSANYLAAVAAWLDRVGITGRPPSPACPLGLSGLHRWLVDAVASLRSHAASLPDPSMQFDQATAVVVRAGPDLSPPNLTKGMGDQEAVAHLMICIGAWKERWERHQGAMVAIIADAPEVMAPVLARIPTDSPLPTVEMHQLVKSSRDPRLVAAGAQLVNRNGPARDAIARYLRSGREMSILGPHLAAACRQVMAIADRTSHLAKVDVKPLSDLVINLKSYDYKSATVSSVDGADCVAERLVLLLPTNPEPPPQAHPDVPPKPPAGDWLVTPVSKAEFARRLNCTTSKVHTMLNKHGLTQHDGHRQLWTVRLDSMDASMRKMLTQPTEDHRKRK